MLTFNLAGAYPAEANAIEIEIETEPPGHAVFVYHARHAEQHVRLPHGTSAVVAVPAEGMLYVELPEQCSGCRLIVTEWFP